VRGCVACAMRAARGCSLLVRLRGTMRRPVAGWLRQRGRDQFCAKNGDALVLGRHSSAGRSVHGGVATLVSRVGGVCGRVVPMECGCVQWVCAAHVVVAR